MKSIGSTGLVYQKLKIFLGRGVDKLFLTSQGLATEVNLDKIAKFTEENHMLLRETQDGLLSVH